MLRPFISTFVDTFDAVPTAFSKLFITGQDRHYILTSPAHLRVVQDDVDPIENVGDPIGRIIDIANGRDAIQYTAGERAIWGTRHGKTVLIPDGVDDCYDWNADGLVGVFWFASPFGCQAFRMTAGQYMPMGMYYECGFFANDRSDEDIATMLAYANSVLPTIPAIHGELLGTQYSVNDGYMGLEASGFRFTSDNDFLSANAPFNNIPGAGFSGITQAANDTYVMEAPGDPDEVLFVGLDNWAEHPYLSTGIYKPEMFSQFPNATNFESWALYFGNSVAFSAFNPTSFYIDLYDTVPKRGYGLSGPLPDLSHCVGITAYTVRNQNFSGIVPEESKPVSMPTLDFYTIVNTYVSGDIPSIVSVGNAANPYITLTGNQFTGYDGGGIKATITAFDGFFAQDNFLSQAAVDLILSDFEDTIGTIVSGTRIINVGGTVNAAPSAAGITSKNNLIAAGWTVTTN